MRYWSAYAAVLHGGSLVEKDPSQALVILQAAKRSYVETGAVLIVPWIVWLEARTLANLGRHDAANEMSKTVSTHGAKLFVPLIECFRHE